MSTQVIALATEFAALPGIRDAVRIAGEPSVATVVLVAIAGVLVGRAMTHGRAAGQD